MFFSEEVQEEKRRHGISDPKRIDALVDQHLKAGWHDDHDAL